MKKDIKKVVGAGVLSLGLVFGLAGFAGATTSFNTTGPDSNNEVRHDSSVDMDFENDNNIDVENRNTQRASSGEAEATHNTEAGDAESGMAENANSLNGTIEVDNSQTASGFEGMTSNGSGNNDVTLERTGPDSNNVVKYESSVDVDVNNDNDIDIDNNNYQSAYSGDAKVYDNTEGGSATTGAVSNTNSSTFTIRVTN